jgi:hypothetical protein
MRENELVKKADSSVSPQFEGERNSDNGSGVVLKGVHIKAPPGFTEFVSEKAVGQIATPGRDKVIRNLEPGVDIVEQGKPRIKKVLKAIELKVRMPRIEQKLLSPPKE